MFRFGKKVEPVKVITPRDNLSLDEIIGNLSNHENHSVWPSSDDVQSLLVQLGSDFKIVNRSDNAPGTNIYRPIMLCVALLLKKSQDNC